MADIADYYLDQVDDEEIYYADYLSGRITIIEAYEKGIIDALGYETRTQSTPKSITCRCCSKTGLTWGKHEGKWRLFESGKLHNCKINPLNENNTNTRQ